MNNTQQPVMNLEMSTTLPDPQRSFINPLPSHRREFETAFSSFYPEPKEESKIDKARAILGEIVKDMLDEELANYMTMFEYLIEGWLDQYERELFVCRKILIGSQCTLRWVFPFCQWLQMGCIPILFRCVAFFGREFHEKVQLVEQW
jgi:hypothetical protein